MKFKVKPKELYLYFGIWISVNVYSLYILVEAQSDILRNNLDHLHTLTDLQQGWAFTSRHKDVSDIEWSSWKYFLQTSWCYLIFQFIVSEFLSNKFTSVLKYWYIVSSVIFVTLYMGCKQMIIIFTQPVIYAIILVCGGKKLSIWITSILLLFSYNSLKYKFYFWSFLEHQDMQDEEVYLILFSVAWIELRCIGYSLDFIESKDRESLNFNDLVNMFSYILYLPLLYTGPIILYQDFENSFVSRKETLWSRIKKFIVDMTFLQMYSLLLDFVFHYIYFFAMQSNMKLIRKLPTIALCGGGLWMGLEFHMKYVVSYGTTAAFARLENMDPPPTPRCIARIHVYSQMWRHFDVGLYRFLVKYIYKPGYSFVCQYGNLSTITYKLIASLATFLFIFVWHGTVWHILVWSVLNYSGITLEHLGKFISRLEVYGYFKKNILRTEAMETRFIAILCTPLLALSAISNFYLFAGSDVGNLFFECISQMTLLSTFILGISLYSCCHISMALEDVPSRGGSKKIMCPKLFDKSGKNQKLLK